MTAPVIDYDTLTLQEKCEAIWEVTAAEERRLAKMQRTQPGVFIFDGHQRLQHLLLEVADLAVEDKENDTGSITLSIHSSIRWRSG
ncbi:hypothetical protein [Gordonia westfalica]|uniref:Uncharacterized protein n=1 Tax=Gordonia westfalica TaxID=158898 RepID=A0A1H2E442_9ACTN|nr:hypothetical protein [Gordonia westfalica]SDT89867.1 hypothetical protein SAMN04488548_12773 [Gordonia westfalica]